VSAADVATAETELLLAHLRSQRRHVLGILEGLDDEALHRPVLPSGWSCLGWVRHLTHDDERFWFRGVVAGEQAVRDEVEASTGSAWQLGPDESADGLLEEAKDVVAVVTVVLFG